MGRELMRERIFVSFVTSWDVDCGIARYSAELVDALRKSVDIVVIPFGPQVWERLKLPSGVVAQRARAVEAAKVASHADIAHIQFQPQFFGGMHPLRCTFPMLLKSLRVPTVVTIHELDTRGALPILLAKSLINIWMLRRRRIEHFIVHNEFTKGWLKRFGVSRSKVTVIPMWVPKVELPKLTKAGARKLLGLDCEHVIGAFGFIVRRRGYELLLEALDPFPYGAVLVIIGGKHPLDESGYYEEFMRRISRWRWKDRVITTGFVGDEELPTWFAAVDFVVAPFIELTESASLLRCIAHGLPIVCSDLKPLRELGERAKCIRLFKAGDALSLRAAVLELLESEDVRCQLAKNAISYAATYRVEQAAALTLRVYFDVLQRC